MRYGYQRSRKSQLRLFVEGIELGFDSVDLQEVGGQNECLLNEVV